MTRIFIDESGDLGFSDKSSKWFIITIVLTNKHRKIEKVIKKIHRGLKKKFRKVNELHAYHSDSVTKKRILKLLAELEDIKILCIVLNKKKVFTDLKKQQNHLYNYTTNILLDRLNKSKILRADEVIEVFLDQRYTNRFLKDNFLNYLEVNLNGWQNNNIKIKLKPSHTEKCLQAVDFVSWAIFRKYEINDYEYYEIIKDKIRKPLALTGRLTVSQYKRIYFYN